MDLKMVRTVSSLKSSCFNNLDLQRRKRITCYNVYSVGGKFKCSLRRIFRLLKDRCSRVVYRWH
ncbi:hypothetical protein KSP39_PZI022247 [Platanthera zijinensis]|uniref:Uncharacterized protein n=1 Tax=Platanthera zijinensis TaxID=2320716 RepID=A0AAP0AUE8_9ASPA